MDKQTVEALFRNLSASIGGPVTELDYINPYTLLVAVVLSAQATDAGVNKATAPLFRLVDTPARMLDLGEEKLTGYIRTIGLFRTKARNVMALSRLLVENHGGEVPRTHEELQALPGVGRKTANVVLNVAFGQPTIAVDTHVFRVANRTGLAHGKTPDQIETGLMKVVPKAYLKDAHHLLILHGRYVCKARRPECPDCAIREQCQFKDKTTGAELKKKGRVPDEPATEGS